MAIQSILKVSCLQRVLSDFPSRLVSVVIDTITAMKVRDFSRKHVAPHVAIQLIKM